MEPIVPQRPLGSQGLMVSKQGLGCMGMTGLYGKYDGTKQEAESLATIQKGLELGINFLDTAWIYQSPAIKGQKSSINEELIGKAIKNHGRERFIITTKFGFTFTKDGRRIVSGKERIIRSQLADSLSRLGTDYIDLYYMHRMDPTTPIEETMRVLKSLVEEGKIRYIGLSECTPEELRRAHAVHPVTAIQMEWSLQTRDIEDIVVPVARELGVGIVAYAPLGRGFLADFTTLENMTKSDSHASHPRFTGQNFEENKRRVQRFYEIAKRKGCTPAQLALAWVHSQGEDVFPIPGTKSSTRIEENANALRLLPLSKEQKREMEAVVHLLGHRTNHAMHSINFESRL